MLNWYVVVAVATIEIVSTIENYIQYPIQIYHSVSGQKSLGANSNLSHWCIIQIYYSVSGQNLWVQTQIWVIDV